MILYTSIVKRYIEDLRKKFKYKRTEYGLSIIDGNRDKYDYFNLVKDIKALTERFPFLTVKSAGVTELKRELYYIKMGKGEKRIFYNGSHSGYDWLTSLMLMKFLEDLCLCYEYNKSLGKVAIQDILKDYTFYIMPMVNPDGVELVVNGLSKDNAYYEKLLHWNNNSFDFSKWSANIRGVDLNYNYDIYWSKCKAKEPNKGVFKPGPEKYCGEMPESEAETKAIVNLINKEKFSMIVCYHKEEEAICYVKNSGSKVTRLRGLIKRELLMFSESNGDIDKEESISSNCKEWFIREMGKPAIAIGIDNDIEFISNSISLARMYKQSIEKLLNNSLII